jgi:hypothetical protein
VIGTSCNVPVAPQGPFSRGIVGEPQKVWLLYEGRYYTLIFHPSLSSSSSSSSSRVSACLPAGSVRLAVTVVQVCQPPVAGILIGPHRFVPDEFNALIRSSSSGCDGIVDQDNAVHDPNNPQAYLPAYDSGDHPHPNHAGYQAIANAVNLGLFETTTDTGGGYDLGWTSAAQWFRYTVNVASAGAYTVSFRVAALGAVTDAFHISIRKITFLSLESPAISQTHLWRSSFDDGQFQPGFWNVARCIKLHHFGPSA